MTSDLTDDQIRKLVSNTESNFKRIESYNGDFVCVALNEWRYATRHIVDMMCHVDEKDNRTQAICHLKRAYFDSYDILLDSILFRFDELHDEYKNYASIVKGYVENYAEKVKIARLAKEIHAQAQDPQKRDDLYHKIGKSCDDLESFVKDIENTADDWRSDIRQQIKKDRLVFVGVAAGVLAAIPTLIMIFKSLVSLFGQ